MQEHKLEVQPAAPWDAYQYLKMTAMYGQPMIVEVFCTDVSSPAVARVLLTLLAQTFPGCRVNFDLQDCDRILRIQYTRDIAEEVILLVQTQGFCCCVLPD